MFGISSFAAAPFASFDTNVVVAVTGVTATGNVGSLTPNTSVALIGVTATGSVGSVGAAISVALTSVTGTGSVGSVTVSSTVAVSGVTGTGSVGTVTPSTSEGEDGTTATGSVGTVTPSITTTISGVTGTGSVGDVVFTQVADLTAVTATGSVGSISLSKVVALTGVTGTGSVGTLASHGWQLIDTEQSNVVIVPGIVNSLAGTALGQIALAGGPVETVLEQWQGIATLTEPKWTEIDNPQGGGTTVPGVIGAFAGPSLSQLSFAGGPIETTIGQWQNITTRTDPNTDWVLIDDDDQPSSWELIETI